MSAPVKPEDIRQDVYLEDVGVKMKEQEEADKKAAEEAERKRKMEEEARFRAEAAAAAPPDPRVRALEEALRISEQARERAQAISTQPTAPVEEKPKELTKEELEELYKNNPLAAIEYMNSRSTAVLLENIDKRIRPLMAGGASSAREGAERKYPDEFKLFRGEIDRFIEALPDKSSLNRPEAWDDLISWIRGKPGNFEKLIESRTALDKEKREKEARDREAVNAGAHSRSVIQPPPSEGNSSLDPIAKQIAQTMGMSDDDYIKWRKIGS